MLFKHYIFKCVSLSISILCLLCSLNLVLSEKAQNECSYLGVAVYYDGCVSLGKQLICIVCQAVRRILSLDF